MMEFACVRKMESASTEVGVNGGREFSRGQKPEVFGDVGFAVSMLVLSVWIVLWIVDYYIMLLWLELSSSDVAHGYKSHDGQHGSFGTPTLCWRGRNHTAFDIRAANGAHLSILIFLVCHLINIF